ncbi:MAG TPA: BON domain-containing protein [Usitatibacter sp.]|nr:BON domain-containing protein [Usitatibacter sp.]
MTRSFTRRLGATFTIGLLALPAFAVDFGPSPPALANYPLTGDVAPTAAPLSGDPIHQGGATPGDTALAADVAAALESDPRLDGATITVAAVNGRVSISGSAQSAEQAAYAEQRAREVAGVLAVSGTLSPLQG